MENVNEVYIPPRILSLTDCYAVFLYGNQFVFSDINKKPCLRKAMSFSKKGKYVEIWYYHSDGSRCLVAFFN